MPMMSAAEKPVIKAGWLQKRGQGHTQWKRRWFVLRGDCLEYYKDSSMADKKGSFELKVRTL